MLPDSMIDSVMPLLPNVKGVTVYAPRDADARANPTPLQARKEDLSESQMAQFADLIAGTESAVFFFPADQPGFVRPRNRWLVVADGFDGGGWTVQKDDLGIQQRGVAVLCTRVPE